MADGVLVKVQRDELRDGDEVVAIRVSSGAWCTHISNSSGFQYPLTEELTFYRREPVAAGAA